jgi:hypothetical protein
LLVAILAQHVYPRRGVDQNQRASPFASISSARRPS